MRRSACRALPCGTRRWHRVWGWPSCAAGRCSRRCTTATGCSCTTGRSRGAGQPRRRTPAGAGCRRQARDHATAGRRRLVGRAGQPGRGRRLLAGRRDPRRATCSPWSRGPGRGRAASDAGRRCASRGSIATMSATQPSGRRSPATPSSSCTAAARWRSSRPSPSRARRPVAGLHPRRGAGVRGDRRGSRPGRRLHLGLQHRRRGDRRHRRARPRRHRPGRRDAGDGGQGGAVQAVRRRRRRARSAWTPRTPTRSSRPSRGWPRASAASTSRTSRRRAASRSSSGSRSGCRSRSSTTTSTARRWSCWPPSRTRCASPAASAPETRVVISGAGAAGVAVARILLAAGVSDLGGHRPSRACCTRAATT